MFVFELARQRSWLEVISSPAYQAVWIRGSDWTGETYTASQRQTSPPADADRGQLQTALPQPTLQADLVSPETRESEHMGRQQVQQKSSKKKASPKGGKGGGQAELPFRSLRPRNARAQKQPRVIPKICWHWEGGNCRNVSNCPHAHGWGDPRLRRSTAPAAENDSGAGVRSETQGRPGNKAKGQAETRKTRGGEHGLSTSDSKQEREGAPPPWDERALPNSTIAGVSSGGHSPDAEYRIVVTIGRSDPSNAGTNYWRWIWQASH